MRFREYMIKEGDLWNAICFGVNSGVQKYRAAKQPPKPEKKISEKKQILNQLMSAKSKEDLSAVVEKMIQSDLRLTADGDLKKTNKNWLLENVQAQKRNQLSQNRTRRLAAVA